MATVVFDLDGTLADTSGDLLAAANAVFRGWGYGNVLDQALASDRGVAMKGGRAMLRLGLDRLYGEVDETRVDAGYQPLLDAYAEALSVETRLFPGVENALERLRSGGHITAICTNKPAALAEALMTELGVRGMFASLVGADTFPVRKPDPKPLIEAIALANGDRDKSVLFGDTITDRSCAQNAGIPCALVTFGPDGHDVTELEPDALMHHYDELETVLEQLGLL